MVILGSVDIGCMEYLSGLGTETFVYHPNSAGGVDVRLNYKNDSQKIIKYVWFTVAPYNQVKDLQCCSITGKTEVRLKETGPVGPGAGRSKRRWENVWYNNNISFTWLKKIEIEYMDGTTETLTGDQIRYGKGGGCYVATAV